MRKFILAAAAAFLASPVAAQAPAPPKLLVVISVDQFSANLFDEYRPQFSAGFARLATGTVFRNGYQSHAATETCPGHSTILTGDHPSKTGIIANDWTDLDRKSTRLNSSHVAISYAVFCLKKKKKKKQTNAREPTHNNCRNADKTLGI